MLNYFKISLIYYYTSIYLLIVFNETTTIALTLTNGVNSNNVGVQVPNDGSNNNINDSTSKITFRGSQNDISKSGWLWTIFVLIKFWIFGFVGFWIAWYFVYTYIVKDHVKLKKYPKAKPTPAPGTYSKSLLEDDNNVSIFQTLLNSLEEYQAHIL